MYINGYLLRGENRVSSCLGIFIDKNLIKYAKLKKINDSIKIESSGIEVFEDLEVSAKKIINETDSQKCPICINISNELYNYFDVFSILEKKDITKSLNIEFELLCDEKSYDINSLESRYILMDSSEDAEKYKSMYISTNVNEIDKKKDLFAEYKLYSMTPVSTSITNLIEYDETENIAIINIENETQITTIVDGQIKRVNVLNKNLEDVLQKVSKELSWKETYRIFDEIHTLDEKENKYLDMIMPVLYKTAKETKKIIDSSNEKISKVYITGMGATINNIDLYFQDFFKDEKCEILKPFFVETTLKQPIKNYAEVNSAISLALDGLGFLNKELNFADVPKLENTDSISRENFNLNKSFSQQLNIEERAIIRVIFSFVIAICIFSILGVYLVKKINAQKIEINRSLVASTEQITNMEIDLSQIESHTNAYVALINSSDLATQTTLTNKINRAISKGGIPELLKKIMLIIPKRVQLLSVKNTESKHIVIEAVSDRYEQLTYFTTNIKQDGILQNVHSNDDETKEYNFKITIEGDLP